MSAADALPEVVSHIAQLQASVEAAEEARQAARSKAAAHIESIAGRARHARAAARSLEDEIAGARRVSRELRVEERALLRLARTVRAAVAALVSDSFLRSAERRKASEQQAPQPGPEEVMHEELAVVRREQEQARRAASHCDRLELRACAIKRKLREYEEAVRSGRERCGLSREDTASTALAGGVDSQAELAALTREVARLRGQESAARRRTAGSRRRQVQFQAEAVRLVEQVKATNATLLEEVGISVPIPIALLTSARVT